MFNHETMNELTKRAKQKLESQLEETQPEDLYESFRNDGEGEEEESVSIRSIPTERDYDVHPRLANHPPEEPNPALAAYDVEVFENGPMVSQVELWKKEWPNHDIFAVEIMTERFVVRTLNRFEYKQLVALSNVNALQREEIICETCVFFPMNYDFRMMANAKAGVISTLAQVIMEHSGFTKEYSIQML